MVPETDLFIAICYFCSKRPGPRTQRQSGCLKLQKAHWQDKCPQCLHFSVGGFSGLAHIARKWMLLPSTSCAWTSWQRCLSPGLSFTRYYTKNLPLSVVPARPQEKKGSWAKLVFSTSSTSHRANPSSVLGLARRKCSKLGAL